MITLKQLEALCQLADHGTIARAANQLYTTESAVSKRLKELEQVLKVNLFDRRGRSLVLTTMGEIVLQMARTLLKQRDGLLDLASSPNFEGRRFRLGMTEFIADGWLPQLLECIQTSYKRVNLEPRIGLSHDLVADLLANDLDLVIVPYSTVAPELIATTLFVSSNVWVCAPEIAKNLKTLEPVDLYRFPLILQPASSALYASVIRWFQDNRTVLPRIISCNSLAGVKNLIMAGFGIAPLPHAYCKADIESGRLAMLEVVPAMDERMYCAVHQFATDLGLTKAMSQIVQSVLTFEDGEYSIN